MQTGNGGRFYQYTIRFTLWSSFSKCSEGRGLGGSPMEGLFFRWIGVGVGYEHMVKDDHMRIVNTQICLCICTG